MSAVVLNSDASLSGKTIPTLEGDQTFSGVNTFTGANNLAGGVAAGSVGTPSIGFDADPDTGIYNPSANVLAVAAGGVQSAKFTTPDSAGIGALVEAPGGAFGAAAGQAGSALKAGRNSSGSTAPGMLILEDKAGVSWYLWVSSTGKLYIGSAKPEADGTPSDTSGTVVGTQT